MKPPQIVVGPHSENYSPRPVGAVVEYFIVHAHAEAVLFRSDAEKELEEIDAQDWLTQNVKGRPRVSAHWLIYPDGQILELVVPILKAWHAGRSVWRGVEDLNRVSLGAELIVADTIGYEELAQGLARSDPFTEKQYCSLGWLVAHNMKKLPITLHRTCGHDEVSGPNIRPDDPKIDPGPNFDWRAFYGWTGEFLYR